jgi:ATP synthase protein I
LIPPLKTKPIRTVLKWQLIATAVITAIAGVWDGRHGAVSALLGGLINVVAGAAYALLLGIGVARITDAGMSLVAMFRAEAGKILLIIAQLWLVLSLYKDVVPLAFFGAFVVTVVVFSMAILVRDS